VHGFAAAQQRQLASTRSRSQHLAHLMLKVAAGPSKSHDTLGKGDIVIDIFTCSHRLRRGLEGHLS
jgi:hypothetical protein